MANALSSPFPTTHLIGHIIYLIHFVSHFNHQILDNPSTSTENHVWVVPHNSIRQVQRIPVTVRLSDCILASSCRRLNEFIRPWTKQHHHQRTWTPATRSPATKDTRGIWTRRHAGVGGCPTVVGGYITIHPSAMPCHYPLGRSSISNTPAVGFIRPTIFEQWIQITNPIYSP